jgi:hypothetical protein
MLSNLYTRRLPEYGANGKWRLGPALSAIEPVATMAIMDGQPSGENV